MINNFSKLKQSTSKLGSVKYRITIDATPAVLTFDAKLLGKSVTDAIAKHLRERVAAISETASPSTIATRKRDLKRLAKGDSKYLADRYAPRRKSPAPKPGSSDRLFNDSGVFAAGIAVGYAVGNTWVINAPSTRLTTDNLHGGQTALVSIYDRLIELVPEIGNPALLRSVLSVRRAINEAIVSVDPRVGSKGRKLNIKSIYNSAAKIVLAAADLTAVA